MLTDDLSGCMHVNSTGYIFQHEASLFPQLQRNGYMTGGFGKIINGQKNTFQPKRGLPITNGWDWLSVPLDEGNYFTNLFFNKRPNGQFLRVAKGGRASHHITSSCNTGAVVVDRVALRRCAYPTPRPLPSLLLPSTRCTALAHARFRVG